MFANSEPFSAIWIFSEEKILGVAASNSQNERRVTIYIWETISYSLRTAELMIMNCCMVQTSKEKNGATEIDQVLGKREREREKGRIWVVWKLRDKGKHQYVSSSS